MLVFAVALFLTVCSGVEGVRTRPSNSDYAQFFTRWLTSRNAAYTADVFQRRFAVFKENYDLVDDHNERFRSGLASFTMALNQWADLTESEYRGKLGFVDRDSANVATNQGTPSVPAPAPRMLGDPIADAMCQRFGIMCRASSTGVARPSSSSSSAASAPTARSSSSVPSAPSAQSSSTGSARSSSTGPVVNPLPAVSSSSASPATPAVSSTAAAGGSTGAPAPGATSVDWRQYGYINPIKDQASCGSCWTFASTSSMEAAWAYKTGQLLSFSEQELLDCAANGARTCNTGGSMQDSWNWLISGSTRRSPMTSAAYPYTESSAASCLYNASRATNAVFSSRVYVQATEAALLAAVQTRPSVAVAIHASGRAFQFYSSGVLSDSTCLSTNLDHAVNVVGYGTDAATGFDYWLVRNSWSTRWGEQGYVKIRRNFNNMCGIATQPTYIVA